MASWTTWDTIMFLITYVVAFFNTITCADAYTPTSSITVLGFQTIRDHVSVPTAVANINTLAVVDDPSSVLLPVRSEVEDSSSSLILTTTTTTVTAPVETTGTESETMSVKNISLSANVTTTLTSTFTAVITTSVMNTSACSSKLFTNTSVFDPTRASLPGFLNLTFPTVTAGVNTTATTTVTVSPIEAATLTMTAAPIATAPTAETVTVTVAESCTCHNTGPKANNTGLFVSFPATTTYNLSSLFTVTSTVHLESVVTSFAVMVSTVQAHKSLNITSTTTSTVYVTALTGSTSATVNESTTTWTFSKNGGVPVSPTNSAMPLESMLNSATSLLSMATSELHTKVSQSTITSTVYVTAAAESTSASTNESTNTTRDSPKDGGVPVFSLFTPSKALPLDSMLNSVTSLLSMATSELHTKVSRSTTTTVVEVFTVMTTTDVWVTQQTPGPLAAEFVTTRVSPNMSNTGSANLTTASSSPAVYTPPALGNAALTLQPPAIFRLIARLVMFFNPASHNMGAHATDVPAALSYLSAMTRVHAAAQTASPVDDHSPATLSTAVSPVPTSSERGHSHELLLQARSESVSSSCNSSEASVGGLNTSSAVGHNVSSSAFGSAISASSTISLTTTSTSTLTVTHTLTSVATLAGAHNSTSSAAPINGTATSLAPAGVGNATVGPVFGESTAVGTAATSHHSSPTVAVYTETATPTATASATALSSAAPSAGALLAVEAIVAILAVAVGAWVFL